MYFFRASPHSLPSDTFSTHFLIRFLQRACRDTDPEQFLPAQEVLREKGDRSRESFMS